MRLSADLDDHGLLFSPNSCLADADDVDRCGRLGLGFETMLIRPSENKESR